MLYGKVFHQTERMDPVVEVIPCIHDMYIGQSMSRLLFILAVSFGSIAAGYLLQVIYLTLCSGQYRNTARISTVLKIVSLLVLQPITIIYSFWNLNLQAHSRLFILPLLGILALTAGGAGALVLIRVFHVPPKRAGSVFTTSMFSNIGSFGALIGYALYGQLGFSLVQLYRAFEEVIYFAVGFPLSQQVSRGSIKGFRFSRHMIMDRPIILIPISGIIIGTVFRLTGNPPPPVLADVTHVMIPLMSGLMGLSIGMTLRTSMIRKYTREVIMVLAVKNVFVPVVVTTAAFLSGLGGIMDGMPFKIVVFVSFMPSAFLALVPPVLYDFDLDLANSAWLITTAALLAVFPLLYLLLI